MPDATLREHIGSEITYSFKFEHRHKFEQLFKQLETNKDRLAIGNYGLSDTTLEEVGFFLFNKELIQEKMTRFLFTGFSMGYRISRSRENG